LAHNLTDEKEKAHKHINYMQETLSYLSHEFHQYGKDKDPERLKTMMRYQSIIKKALGRFFSMVLEEYGRRTDTSADGTGGIQSQTG